MCAYLLLPKEGGCLLLRTPSKKKKKKKKTILNFPAPLCPTLARIGIPKGAQKVSSMRTAPAWVANETRATAAARHETTNATLEIDFRIAGVSRGVAAQAKRKMIPAADSRWLLLTSARRNRPNGTSERARLALDVVDFQCLQRRHKNQVHTK